MLRAIFYSRLPHKNLVPDKPSSHSMISALDKEVNRPSIQFNIPLPTGIFEIQH